MPDAPFYASLTTNTLVAGFIITLTVGVISAYTVRSFITGRTNERRLRTIGDSAFLGMWLMEAFYWSFRAPGRLCAKLGIHPDVLTWTSLVLALATLPAAVLGHFSTAGGLVVASAIFDILDGMVARELKIASDSGEMLDAIVDRYADAAPLIGLAVFYRFSLWQMAIPFAALMGTMMVSYVRAKTEALGLKLPSGLMRRHERITYLAVALVIAPELSPWLGKPAGAMHPGTLAIVALVAVVSNFAAFRLVAAARAELVKQGRGPKGASSEQ